MPALLSVHAAVCLAFFLSKIYAQVQEVQVDTGRTLQIAVRNGDRAVLITEHLDVRRLSSPVIVITDDISIRGECGSAWPNWLPSDLDPELLPLQPGQCLILTDDLLFEVRSSSFAQVTFENLYIRLQQFTLATFRVKLMAFSGASVWLSKMTMQGDRGEHEALAPFDNAALHISDSTLQNFNSTEGPLLSIEKNSSTVFEGCKISDITNPEVNGSAVLAGVVDGRVSSSVLVLDSNLSNVTSPFFAFQLIDAGVFYSDKPLDVFDGSAGADQTIPALDAASAGSGPGAAFLRLEDRPVLPTAAPAVPPAVPPAVAPPAEGPGQPTADPPMGGTPVNPPIVPPSTPDTAVIAGGAAAAAVVGLLLIAFIVFRIQKKRARRSEQTKQTEPSLPPIKDGAVDHTGGLGGGESQMPTDANGVPPLPWNKSEPPHMPDNGAPTPFFSCCLPPSRHAPSPRDPQPYQRAPSQHDPHAYQHAYAQHPHDPHAYQHAYTPHPAGYAGPPQWHAMPQGPPPALPSMQFGSMQSWALGRSSGYNPQELRVRPTTTFTAGSSWSDYQKAAHDSESPLDALEVALDAMCCMKQPFYDRYILLSSVERRVGGQGLVQFASIINTQEKAAIKFYMDASAFQRERDLYQDSQLKSMMPATLAIDENQAGHCHTPYGYTFPPFVIIECGQSLDEWARDNMNTDFITVFQALSHSVRALRKLHGAGYAHRDIKPGNILRRPKQHDWTLIDFGCAAQIGTTAGLSYSLKYAPPEVMHAVESGCRTIHVDAAVDIWAIGVIAYELLTGERAFPAEGLSMEDADQKARDAIVGRTLLPWEAMSDGAKERLGKMRGLKRTVLRCLERDPAKRPSAEALLKSWDHTFDDMQTRGTEWSMGSAETNQSSAPP